ncbi:hypothetical protein TIFTF001_034689 [Ficus carica]|uniref:Uncharacterized protein n=1 Tax=Ficus carica TaxID=3494 RepID=A0AA88E0N5_FICCA|nr:hypothetical protein TIFTF001_034671 [Ficus carica]GMN65619.1 hypothetical protein TIFTF001_034689 [Ficus carica]
MASKLPRVVPIRTRSGLVHDLGTQVSKVTAHVYVIIPLRRWCKSGRYTSNCCCSISTTFARSGSCRLGLARVRGRTIF